MKATRNWGACQCGMCKRNILCGDEFTVLGGDFYLYGHECGNLGLDVKQDVSRARLHEPAEQQPITDLPLFEDHNCQQVKLNLSGV